jgi:DNA-binding NarL/FixJ family response regulator
MKIRIMLADDHRLFREGLHTLLQQQADIEVIGMAVDGSSIVDTVAKCKPDVVLMDISMPGLNGIEATWKLLAEYPDVRVIILSMHTDHRFVVESLRAGALGYVLKDCQIGELLEAIKSVVKRQIYLSQPIAEAMVRNYLALAINKPESAFAVLTGREREVLQMLSEGHSSKEIAGALQVSVKTVESHRKNIMDKLNIHSVAELTKYAIREGLTSLE